MSRRGAPYLILIRNGPVYNLENHLAYFARAFDRLAEGEILTWGEEAREIRVGRYLVRSYHMPYERPLHLRAWYLARLIGRGLLARWVRGRKLVVIAYDPFQSGLAAFLIKLLTGARFVCEVNGVYGHPDTLADVPADEATRRRRKMLRLGTFILRRADRIKLLYPGQLMGFRVDHERPRRFAFHDLVDDAMWTSFPRGEAEDALIFVGHPFYLKGLDLLLEAFHRLAPEFPTWKLIMVGWRIEEEARASGAPLERVEFHGPLPPQELARHVARAKAIVLPSRSEGMGRVLLEAGFLERARIGSTACGIPYVIRDGVDGLLFRTGDVDDLERILRTFMSDAGLQQRLARAAADRARRQYSTEAYVRHYGEVLSDLGITVPAVDPDEAEDTVPGTAGQAPA